MHAACIFENTNGLAIKTHPITSYFDLDLTAGGRRFHVDVLNTSPFFLFDVNLQNDEIFSFLIRPWFELRERVRERKKAALESLKKKRDVILFIVTIIRVG